LGKIAGKSESLSGLAKGGSPRRDTQQVSVTASRGQVEKSL